MNYINAKLATHEVTDPMNLDAARMTARLTVASDGAIKRMIPAETGKVTAGMQLRHEIDDEIVIHDGYSNDIVRVLGADHDDLARLIETPSAIANLAAALPVRYIGGSFAENPGYVLADAKSGKQIELNTLGISRIFNVAQCKLTPNAPITVLYVNDKNQVAMATIVKKGGSIQLGTIVTLHGWTPENTYCAANGSIENGTIALLGKNAGNAWVQKVFNHVTLQAGNTKSIDTTLALAAGSPIGLYQTPSGAYATRYGKNFVSIGEDGSFAQIATLTDKQIELGGMIKNIAMGTDGMPAMVVAIPTPIDGKRVAQLAALNVVTH